jgi:hypothetical protein
VLMSIDLEKLYTIMIFKMKKIKNLEVFKILNNQDQTHHSKSYNLLRIPNIKLINLMVTRHSQFLKKVILKIIE